MDPILVGAAGTYAVGSALALGAVAGRPAYLATKAAALWAAERVLAAALRPRFDRSASWWVDQHRVRPVARHAAPLAWTDPAGRAAAVRAGVRLRVDAAHAAWSRLTGAVPPFGVDWVTA
jgi:hypothetical protein